MDLFKLPRYRMNILLLKFLGQWPYQSKRESTILSFSWLLIVLSGLIPQIHRFIVTIIDPTEEVMMDNVTALLTISISFGKMLNSILNEKKFRRLISLMENEWKEINDGPDYDIMTNYANSARTYSIFYAIIFYNSMVIYLLLPMRQKVMVWLGLMTDDAEVQLPYPVDYWVDSDKYFLCIETHGCISVTFVVTAVVAPDCFFFVFVRHACGIFSVISYRLENIANNSFTKADFHDEKIYDKSFAIIRDCIQQHNRVIEFLKLLDDAYCWSFLYVVGINTLLLTFSGMQIVTHMDDPNELFQYGPFAIGQLVHIFTESVICQQLMDHSEQVDNSIIMMKWYDVPLKTRKLLNLMTLRSRAVCKITAGKFFVFSVELFSTIVKTSMSYFTLLRSMAED